MSEFGLDINEVLYLRSRDKPAWYGLTGVWECGRMISFLLLNSTRYILWRMKLQESTTASRAQT
jgi:hypothetical protein